MPDSKSQGPMEQLGETLGGVVGRVAGRMNDMALNAVGSVLGAVLEQMGDWWASPDARRATSSFDAATDEACRSHFASGGAAAARDYDQARPFYQFGHLAGQNPDYQSRPFEQVEPELERAWEQFGRDRFGEWSGVRDQVSFGYTVRTPGAPNPS